MVVNYAGSKDAAEAVAKEIEGIGVKAMAIKVSEPSLCASAVVCVVIVLVAV